jgi:hypothetical protein
MNTRNPPNHNRKSQCILPSKNAERPAIHPEEPAVSLEIDELLLPFNNDWYRNC